jgi:hypothetical protein
VVEVGVDAVDMAAVEGISRYVLIVADSSIPCPRSLCEGKVAHRLSPWVRVKRAGNPPLDGKFMRDSKGPWVVYLKTVHGSVGGTRAVCAQSEWEAMERTQPGAQTLIQGGIVHEGEAERLARGSSGDKRPGTEKKK